MISLSKPTLGEDVIGDEERMGSDTIEMVDESTPTKDKVKGKIESLSSSQSEKQKKLESSLVPFGSSSFC